MKIIKTLVVTQFAAVLSLIGTPVFAQVSLPDAALTFPGSTANEDVQRNCIDMSIVQIDNIYKCTPKTEPAISADSLDAIISDMEKENLSRDPVQAGSEGNREALRHLPPVTQAAIIEGVTEKRSLYQRYLALNRSALQGENKLNYDLLGFILKQELDLAGYDEARVSFTNDSGFFNMLSYVSRQTKFETADDYEAYAARLSEIPRYFEEHKANMRRGIASDYTASAEIMPGIINTVKGLATGVAEEHSFYQPFNTFSDLISETERTRLKILGKAAMNESVFPAYKDLRTFLENEYAPKARKVVCIGTNKYYKALVKHFTTLDLTPDDVHHIGLDEVKRIRAEMDGIIAETGFEGDFEEFLSFLRTDNQFYVDTPEALLKEAAWIAKRIDGQMPHYFGKLPRLSYGVQPVPDEITPS